MNYKDKISSIVEEVLTEKTFSLEIVTKIKALKDDFDDLIKVHDEAKREIEFQQKTNKDLREVNQTLLSENTAYKAREDELEKKEKAADKVIYELEFQKKRGDEIKELFGIVFKNPVVRESAYKNGSVPVPGNNGSYPTTMTSSESETKTTEQE